jgi:hypothetical protein
MVSTGAWRLVVDVCVDVDLDVDVGYYFEVSMWACGKVVLVVGKRSKQFDWFPRKIS